MAVTSSNIKLEPCDVFLGKRHEGTATFVADSGGSLNNKYFTVLINGVSHYVWFNINAAGVDPAPAGMTELAEVAAATGATAATLATGAAAAINAAALGVTASAASGLLTIKHLAIGLGTIGAGNSGFTVAQTATGEKTDLGATSEIAVALEVAVAEITASQLGTQKLDEIFTGANATVSMSLMEMTVAKWAKIVGGFTGSNFTPAGGDEITGYGEFKNFKNASAYAMELVLKPTGSTDDLRNLHFWKAYPIPSSINFSGEEPQVMEVEFRCLRDETKDTKINLFAFGNAAQDLT